MTLKLHCRLLAKLLSQSQDGAPPLAIRARTRLHLMTCQACRNVDAQMRFVRKAMQAAKGNPSIALSAPDQRR